MQATNVANSVYKHINEVHQVRVFDWQHPSKQTGIIWEAIETAERLTSAGIFLFMSDDALSASQRRRQMAKAAYIFPGTM
jgi:hypothetical protein